MSAGRKPDGSRETEGLERSEQYATLPRLRLAVVEGPDRGTHFVTRAARTVIGTHESADLVLGDRAVSRFHCEIIAGGEGPALIRDLGSRNGTIVDGVSVLRAHLSDRAELSLGRTRVTVAPDIDNVRIPLYPREEFGALAGRSRAMRAVFAVLERAAGSEATVLLTGETGTGKDVAAESIVSHGPRSEGPLVVVDCGAIPEGLMESELFGHESGAFTGADRPRRGAFEAADGGTLFLDEIGELTLTLQPKLLRAIDRREVQRIGSEERRRVDVRIIAATNRNLREEVNAGRFRADLYYRLAVMEIRMPSLAERREDVPLLAEQLLRRIAGDPEAASTYLTDAFRAELTRHSWPGNVRELRNYLERCVAFGGATPRGWPEEVGGDSGPPALDFERELPALRDEYVRWLERTYLREVLRRESGNVSAAARAAGIDRTSFYRLLVRCGLR